MKWIDVSTTVIQQDVPPIERLVASPLRMAIAWSLVCKRLGIVSLLGRWARGVDGHGDGQAITVEGRLWLARWLA